MRNITKSDGRPLRLAGVEEAAEVYGVDEDLTRRILADADAPLPVATLAGGPVYDLDDIEEHAATRGGKTGRPSRDRRFPADMRIADDDPLWDDHDGGSGHDKPEWGPGDETAAVAYWEALSDKGRDVLAYLLNNPGRLVHHGELGERLRLDPEGTKRMSSVVAGTLNRLGAANDMVGRSFPYRWWTTREGTVYAAKHEVAAVFSKALGRKPRR